MTDEQKRKRDLGPQLPEGLPPPLYLDDAACDGMDAEIFFPVTEIRAEGQWRRPRTNYDEAKVVCAGCCERELCLAYALRHNIRYGCFGGTSPRERSAIRQAERLKKAASSAVACST